MSTWPISVSPLSRPKVTCGIKTKVLQSSGAIDHQDLVTKTQIKVRRMFPLPVQAETLLCPKSGYLVSS